MLCFLLSATKNDKTENKTGEPKKPKTTGNSLREKIKSRHYISIVLPEFYGCIYICNSAYLVRNKEKSIYYCTIVLVWFLCTWTFSQTYQTGNTRPSGSQGSQILRCLTLPQDEDGAQWSSFYILLQFMTLSYDRVQHTDTQEPYAA